MKAKFLGGFFCIMISVTLSAQNTGPITVEKKGLKKTYSVNEENLTMKQLTGYLKSYPEPAKKYQNYKAFHIAGLSSMGVGTIFLGVGLYYSIKGAQTANDNNLEETVDYSNKGGNNLLIGAGFFVLSIPFNILAKSNLKKSIELYNNTQTTAGINKVTLMYGITDNGVGILLRF